MNRLQPFRSMLAQMMCVAKPRLSLFLLLATMLVSTQASAVDVLVSSFTDAPDPAVRGGTIVYTASVTNNTTDTARNVALALSLDAQTSFVAVSDPACSYAAGTHTVTCSYATLAGDISGPGSAQVKTINLTVRILSGAGATVDNRATVTTTDPDVNPANDTLLQTTTVDNGADLALTLAASPLTAPASSLITYTASLRNNGPNSSGQVTSSFTLSPHLTYQSASGTGWTCGAVAQVVTCTRANSVLGDLPNIVISTRATGAFTGTLTTIGTVAISGSAIDFNNSNDTSTVDVQITTGTDLAMTKTASAAVVGGNQAMSFTLLPRNLGPFAATNVSVSDTLPAGFTNISASGTGWTCGVVAQTVTCTSASYAIGASNDITVNASAPAVASTTTFTNTASISSDTPDGVSANNSGSVNVDVLPDGVDLSLTKTKGPNPVAQGANINSTIIVTNHGPRAAASGEVRVTETLIVGETYVGIASGTNWTCGAQIGQVVTCTYNAALAAGASAPNLVLITTAVNTGALTNTACTNYVGGVTDPTPANNCASASTTSTASGTAIDLGIVKTVDLPVLVWNAPTVTYTLTINNAGPGTATGVIVSDAIPGYINGSTVVNASRIGGTSAATFTCSNAATVVCSQTGGTIAPGETVIFSIAVSRPLIDSNAQAGNVWTNTATVRSQTIGDINLANNSSSVNVQVDPVADVTVVNTVTPTTALAGTQATYVLTVTNNGPSSAQNVTISDVFNMAAGSITFLSASPSVGTCGAYDAGTRSFNCALGALASGGTATVTVVVRPDYMVAPPSPRTISNTATVATTTQESNTGNNSATSVLNVTLASLDLLVNNTDNIDPLGYTPTPVGMDNIVTYRNTITNRGPSVASGLVMTYTMRPPTGKSLTFLGDKLLSTGQVYANYCNNLNQQVTGPATLTVTCTFPPGQILLANNATTDLYLDYRVDSQPNANGDAYSSTVTIAANEPETVSANNSVSQTTTIKMRSDLLVTKTARAFVGGSDVATNNIQIRQPFYWLITVTNNGPGNSQVTTVTDSLPANVALYTGGSIAPYNAAPYNAGVRWSTDNATPSSGTCTGSTTLTCNIGILENGKVATIRIPVISTTVGSPATRQNCVSAVTSEVDPNAANNTNICNTITMQRSSIDGTVYLDANNNAAKGAGEVGIAGVSMRLDGVDVYGNTITNLTATTDATGYYIFANRAPGTYTVSQVQPSGYIDGRETAGSVGGTATGATGDAISAIVLPANTISTGYLFGELQPASLSGFVFTDLNNDARRNLTGVPATDESSGITGVNITLTGVDDLGAVNTSTNTVANGAYSFSNLRPGTYQVQQSAIAGLTHTGMTVGSKGGNDGASVVAANTAVVGATKRTVSNIVLGNNDVASQYNFGESGQGLSGFVYLDLNNNGVKDAGELGIAGVSVTLSGNTASNANVCVAISPNPCTIVTDTNGAYNFVSLPASAAAGYTLTEQAQASSPLSNYADGIDSVGTVNNVTTGSAANDSLSGIVIALGQVGVNYNFGERTSSLAGKVYVDVDQNNALNAGDSDLAGVTITLSGTTASGVSVCTLIASCTTTTDASGNFSFTGLPASNGAGYTLLESQPLDFVDANNTLGTGTTQAGAASVAAGNSQFTGIVLSAGQSGITYLFGEKTGSLSGFAYQDHNNNGNKDAGEDGIAGVTITLTGQAASGGFACGAAVCTTTTAADGSYTFTQLRNANGAGYTVTESQPAGYLDGITRKGTVSNVSCAACVDTVANAISAIPFNAANSHANFNFGELQPASLSGFVFNDLNNDAQRNLTGVPATDESAGITGVSISLTGVDDRGAVNLSTNTIANGAYSFSNLRPGTYQVQQSVVAGLSHTGMTVGSKGGNDGASAIAANTAVTGSTKRTVSNIVLSSNDAASQYNFGEIGQSLSGFVYLDLNNNGVKDARELGIAGVSVTLSGNTSSNVNVCTAISPSSCTIVTDSNGAYSFNNLPASAVAGYTLTEQAQASSPLSNYGDGIDSLGTVANVTTGSAANDSFSGIVIGVGQVGANYNFGERTSSLAGKVYVDVDQNNALNAGDSDLAGVTITLSGTTASGVSVCTLIASCTTTTDASGNFSFTGLPASNGAGYTLLESQPLDFVDANNTLGTGTTQAGAASVAAGNSQFTGIVLSAGQSGITYLFGEKTGSLSGFAYQDHNNNGNKDAGEDGIAGVTITLTGQAASGGFACGAAVCTTTTAADGSYTFTQLRNANGAGYTVTETQPAAYLDGITRKGTVANVSCAACVDSVANVISAIPFNAGNSHANFNFGEISNGSITGTVYFDANSNGVRDAGELGIAGVPIALSGTLTRNTSTDASGNFSFTALQAGNYTLTEVQPSGYIDGVDLAGTSGGTVNTPKNAISNITLAAGANATGYLFGEKPTELARDGSISGKVYGDTDKNGSHKAGEPLLKDVSISLSGVDFENKIVQRTEKTDAKGEYIFRDVAPGRYTITETQPIAWSDFADGTGSKVGSLAGGVAAMNSITSLLMPMSGGNATGYDFREFAKPISGNLLTSSIAGKVYLHTPNQPDVPLAGVTIKLNGVDSDGKAIAERSAVTQADGSYIFSQLLAGTYSLQEVQPSQWGDFPANSGSILGSVGGQLDSAANKMTGIVLPASTEAVRYDFREKPASLAGVVYRDINHNGQQNAGEIGIANVTVILFDTNGEFARSSSAADGSFSFNNLPAGNYRMQEVHPTGYLDGKESAGQINGVQVGSVDNTGFDASAATNSILGIALPAGQDGTQYLFGERLYQLSGFVYFDDNHNASKDSGEQGIGSVRVTISGTPDDGSDLCQQINCVVRTNADGSFSFTQLPPGTYRLVETQSDVEVGKVIDGKETAGTAGGNVMNASFGSQVLQNTIQAITLNSNTAPDGVASGYLFGERVRSGPTLKPPIVSGYVWFDTTHTRVRPTDVPHQGVAGWTVTLTQQGKFICTVTTDSNGFYQFDNLHCPGYEESGLPSGTGFDISFRKDGNMLPNVATSGGNAGTVAGGSIRNLTLNPGDDITEQNLPLVPAGVVYDSVTRLPVAGAVVTITGPAGFDPAQHLLGGLVAEKQTTGVDGYYQFLLQNNYPSGTYHLSITSYPSQYIAAPSSNIPVCQGVLNVGAQPDPALVQKSNAAPALSVAKHAANACVGLIPQGALDTQYYTSFNITPSSAPVLNNHLPLDPFVPGTFSLSKTGDKQQVEIGETVGYSIVVKQTSGSKIAQITVRDSLPAGFTLVPGTVRLNGKAIAEPKPSSVLAFDLGGLNAGQSMTLTYRVRVGVGSMQGDGINRAIAFGCALPSCVNQDLRAHPNSTPSNEGQFKVKVMPGVFTNDACLAGKIFVDCNNNHVQDAEELGIPGVRLYLQDGTHLISDIEGKYSYCGLSPKSHVIKVDQMSLPRRSILTTTSNRNLGDANSLWLDVKNGDLIRADFAEGSCSNAVLEQVKARRSQGGVRSVEMEVAPATSPKQLPGLQFKSKAPNAPRQATDSANQELVQPRQGEAK